MQQSELQGNELAEEAEMTFRPKGLISNRMDCREKFVRRFYKMERAANEGFINPHLKLYTPFIDISKADIVAIGYKLEVPYEATWSCYEGSVVHCGRCATCVERAEAFANANVPDPTLYEDPDYWKIAVAEFRGL